MISVLSSLSAGVAAIAAALVPGPASNFEHGLSLLRNMLKPTAVVRQEAATPNKSLREIVAPLAKSPKSKFDVLCSLESSNLELPVILKLLSDQTKVNLVLLGASESKLTVRLKNVRLMEMLNHLCALADLAYLEVGSTILVAPEKVLQEKYPAEWAAVHPAVEAPTLPEVVPPPPAVTKIYRGSYFDAGKVGEMLTKMFPDSGLTAAGAPIQISPSVSQRETFAATGISQGIVKSEEGVGKAGRILVLHGPEKVVDLAIEVAKQLDLPRAQVSIAVTIHDISNDALKQLGLAWDFGNLTLSEVDPRGINFGSISRAPLSAVATIRAMEQSDAAKLLASPNISVLDGEAAFILIGNRLNFPVLVGYSQSNTPIFDKQEERVGIYLQVSASISESGLVTLSLYPQVSTVTGFLEVNGGSYPQIATREAQTTLRVASGESIVMGGMLKDEELSSVERVPLLSRIPFLGELFTHRKKTKTSSQVIITITPTIIQSENP